MVACSSHAAMCPAVLLVAGDQRDTAGLDGVFDGVGSEDGDQRGGCRASPGGARARTASAGKALAHRLPPMLPGLDTC